MTQTTEPRNVPLPTGATFADVWQASGAGMPYRFVAFTDRTVTDHPASVSRHPCQWADGSLDDGSGVAAPGIDVVDAGIQPLNGDQARELAAALLAAARKSTGWRRDPSRRAQVSVGGRNIAAHHREDKP